MCGRGHCAFRLCQLSQSWRKRPRCADGAPPRRFAQQWYNLALSAAQNCAGAKCPLVKKYQYVSVTGGSPSIMSKQRSNYPVGSSVSIGAISRDPYPTYARMLQVERTSWVDALNMWWVTGYNDVTNILMDS